MLSQPVCKHM